MNDLQKQHLKVLENSFEVASTNYKNLVSQKQNVVQELTKIPGVTAWEDYLKLLDNTLKEMDTALKSIQEFLKTGQM